jgi:hypothetical protein
LKIVVAGGRDFNDKDIIFSCLDKIVKKDDIIISGHASGVDSWGECYADVHGLQLEIYPAQWGVYGKSAGPIRNEQMAKIADKVILFWNGKSRGTYNMLQMAKKYQCEIVIFDYKGNLKD